MTVMWFIACRQYVLISRCRKFRIFQLDFVEFYKLQYMNKLQKYIGTRKQNLWHTCDKTCDRFLMDSVVILLVFSVFSISKFQNLLISWYTNRCEKSMAHVCQNRLFFQTVRSLDVYDTLMKRKRGVDENQYSLAHVNICGHFSFHKKEYGLVWIYSKRLNQTIWDRQSVV